eukprot:scaffold1459_cov183-Chaetoceros_neogracile.AAC.9
MKLRSILGILAINLALTIAISVSSKQAASTLIQSLVINEKCFTSTAGAQLFADSCASNVIYEDCYHPQPFVGRRNVQQLLMDKVAMRKNKGDLRLDRISDGTRACGFAWTHTCGEEEGLRGTTFVELNEQGQIQYVREIPEPIFKPGDLTLELLKVVTEGEEKIVLPDYLPRIPMDANDIVKYLFNEVQGRDVDTRMDFYSEDIIYRDFNYENVLKGKEEVRQFIEDFSFPGIEFKAQRFDDGVLSTCFTWEVLLMDAPETIKGISFYELDPDTRKITYVRDVPESAIKPPILGKIARQLRPGLGVFQGVQIGSRPGGM